MEEDMKQEPEFTPQNLNQVFCILLKAVGGIGISKKQLDEMPEDIKWACNYDTKNEMYYLFVPEKRKRSIITPRKNLFIPN